MRIGQSRYFGLTHQCRLSGGTGDTIACDIAHVPLEEESLDLAVFCLSLMGSNFTEYIREAHRCLRLDGVLHIWEAASYFDHVRKFCTALGRLGFEVTSPSTEGAFVRIYAIKNAKKPDEKLVLPFRGAAVVPGREKAVRPTEGRRSSPSSAASCTM